MLDIPGYKNKISSFGRRSVSDVKRLDSSKGKGRVLFFVCALFGAIFCLMLALSSPQPVKEDSLGLAAAADLNKAVPINQKRMPEFSVAGEMMQNTSNAEQDAVAQAGQQVTDAVFEPVSRLFSLQKPLEDDSFAQLEPASGDSLGGGALGKREVQAVLIARRQVVISSEMSGKILEAPFQNGDTFSAGDILAHFDCALEGSLYKEKNANLRLAKAELQAKMELHRLGNLSEIEYIAATENVTQEQAQLEQIEQRISLCTIKAPFDGRVVNRLASPYEYAERGRVLMEVSSSEPLLLQFLVPSIWLRWLNVGTPFDVYVEESGKTYLAKVIRVHGKVDPVSQTAEIVAEMSSYQEELLPGMGGKSIFDVGAAQKQIPFGFIGLKVAAKLDAAPQDWGDGQK